MSFRIRFVCSLSLLVCGLTAVACRDGKVQQIQRGIHTVDQHAQEIERAAASSRATNDDEEGGTSDFKR